MALFQIEAPHFVAGVIVGERAAPIIKYMKDWSEDQIKIYCNIKGWTVFKIHDHKEDIMNTVPTTNETPNIAVIDVAALTDEQIDLLADAKLPLVQTADDIAAVDPQATVH
jgi:hypothetical protein